MNPRVNEVATALIEALRSVLERHAVTEEEYRAGVHYVMKVAEAREAALMCDVFLNSTVVASEARVRRGSRPAIQGPYFREGAPLVDGALKTYETDRHRPLLIQGRVVDPASAPVTAAVIDVWHSTPDGKYSGFHDDIPLDYYRGKLVTDVDGRYRVRTTMPAAYQIPDRGPTGALLDMMGRHSWRPAHVHFKVRKDGFRALTTQYYFEGGDWVGDDCCNGVSPELIVPNRSEAGVQVMNLDFMIEPVAA